MNRSELHSPTPPVQDSPLGRFLQDPHGTMTQTGEALLDWVAGHGPWLAALAAGAVLGGLVARRAVRRSRHAALARRARLVEVAAPPEVDPAGARALWGQLVGLLRPAWARGLVGQPHLVWEYAWSPAGMAIRIWVPGPVPPGLVERAVEAAWPGAATTTQPATSPLPDRSIAAGGVLRLARPDHYPLRADHDTDPLRALTGAAAGLGDGEHAVVQVLARPVTGRRLRAAHRAAAALRAGRQATARSRLFDTLTPAPTGGRAAAWDGRADPERAAQVRAILDKAAQPRWEALLRYGLASPPGGAGARRWLRGRAHALAGAFALYSGHNQLTRRRLRRPARALAARWLGRGDLLGVPELAALAHLPEDTTVPGLVRAGARAVPPPPPVHTTGGAELRPLGQADAGIPRPVALAVADARHHLHVLGKTGVGKSTLLAHMVLADAAARRAAVVIDPKGDLVTDLLARLPETAAGRVVLFDPDQPGPPPSLDMLAGPDPGYAVDTLVGIFHRIFDRFWGPRTDDVLRAACLTLTRHPGTGLADIPRLLSDPTSRRALTKPIRDEVLAGFWTWYDGLSEPARAHMVGPLLNKLRAFLLRDFARHVVAASTPPVELGRLLDDGGVCLVRLPKGVLGEDTTRLLGSFILAKLWQAAAHRARRPQAARADAALYLDECHNFLTLPHGLADMLAEARAYRLSLVLAHQDLAQLPRDLREAISANTRSKVFFTVSPEDARDLTHHTTPNLGAHDLAHLDAYQAAARLHVGGGETPAFTLRTHPLPPPAAGRARLIRATARRHHPYTRAASPPARPHPDDPRAQPTRRTP